MVFDYDYTGNRSLLDRPTVAFFASREVSPSLRERALRWAEACCRSDRVVLSGFQSPLEKELFRLLLRARHPLVWGLGRRLYSRYEPEVEAALAEGRMLIFAVRNASRTGCRRRRRATACWPRWPTRRSTSSTSRGAAARSGCSAALPPRRSGSRCWSERQRENGRVSGRSPYGIGARGTDLCRCGARDSAGWGGAVAEGGVRPCSAERTNKGGTFHWECPAFVSSVAEIGPGDSRPGRRFFGFRTRFSRFCPGFPGSALNVRLLPVSPVFPGRP